MFSICRFCSICRGVYFGVLSSPLHQETVCLIYQFGSFSIITELLEIACLVNVNTFWIYSLISYKGQDKCFHAAAKLLHAALTSAGVGQQYSFNHFLHVYGLNTKLHSEAGYPGFVFDCQRITKQIIAWWHQLKSLFFWQNNQSLSRIKRVVFAAWSGQHLLRTVTVRFGT